MTTVPKFAERRKARALAVARAKWPAEMRRMMRAMDKVRAGHSGRISTRKENGFCIVRDGATGKILLREAWDEVDEAEHRLIAARALMARLKASELLQKS